MAPKKPRAVPLPKKYRRLPLATPTTLAAAMRLGYEVYDAGIHNLDQVPVERLAEIGTVMLEAMSAMSAQPIAQHAACGARSCSWCCHQAVDVSPAEVVTLVGHLRSSLSPEDLTLMQEKARTAAKRADGLDNHGYARAKIACPILADDGSCSQYVLRPAVCRTYHSTDLNACKRAFEDPHAVVHSSVGVVRMAAGMIVSLGAYLESRGLDGRTVKLIPALDHFLNDASAAARWRSGGRLPDHILISGLPETQVAAWVSGKLAVKPGR